VKGEDPFTSVAFVVIDLSIAYSKIVPTLFRLSWVIQV